MASERFAVVVVGAGLMGSAAALAAAQRSARVLLLEQFDRLHALGSSHGDSRIFRIAYANETYAKMCIDSLEAWRELERASGETLLTMTGELDIAHDRTTLQGIVDVLTRFDKPFEELSGQQVNERFPGFSLSPTARAVLNPNAAMLNPTKAMDVLQRLAEKHGAEVRDKSKVLTIKHAAGEDGDAVEIELENGDRVLAEKCIVTAGPWTNKLLSQRSQGVQVAFQPLATFGTYWKATDPSLYTPDKFPVFIDYGGSGAYGLPLKDPSVGVKVCSHLGPDVDPDARQQITKVPEEDVAKLRAFITQNMSSVDASAVNHADLCMYSMTKDHDFILDKVVAPGANADASKNLVVGAGFSGHGAKMTPVIGQILADLALKGETTYPIDMFKLSRLG